MSKKLLGWQIIVLRSKVQGQALCTAIEAYQGTPVLLPLINIVPIIGSPATQHHWKTLLKRAQLLIAVSPNAVYCLPESLCQILRQKNRPFIITMGKATSQAFAEKGISVNFTALPGSSSESLLAEAFLQKEAIAGKKIVLLAGHDGRTLLAEILQQRDAQCDWIKDYHQERVEQNLAPLIIKWQQAAHCCFVVLSNNSLDQLLTLTPSDQLTWLQSQFFLVASPRIAERAKTYGLHRLVISASAHQEDLMVKLLGMVDKKA